MSLLSKARFSITLFVLVCATTRCDSPSGGGKSGGGGGQDPYDDEDGEHDSGPSGNTSSPGANGTETPASGQACSDAERDCPNVVCYCVSKPGDFPSPINTHKCNNGYCVTPGAGCADSCAAFSMSWTGEYEVLSNSPQPQPGNGGSSGSSDSAGNSCEYAYDDECDDATYGGSGYCPEGTDDRDCGY